MTDAMFNAVAHTLTELLADRVISARFGHHLALHTVELTQRVMPSCRASLEKFIGLQA